MNNFREKLVALQSDPLRGKAATDGLKVIDCLRFIKVNDPFISYAFKNRHDNSIYSYYDDKEKGALRDFNGTSFHINLYHDENKTEDECLKICLEDLQNNTRQFEDAYNLMVKENKLNEFIDKLTYDQNTGCLALRTIAAQMYAKEIETLKDSKKLMEGLYFEELMNKIAVNFDPEDEDKNYQMVYDYFEPFLGKWCRYDKSDEVEITHELIIKYMSSVMAHSPPNVLPGEKFFEEYVASHSESENKAVKLIAQERSLVKVFSTSGNNESMLFIINQLKDPANTRPIPRYNTGSKDRSKVWDPRDQKITSRQLNSQRGLPKRPDWKYTKKTATTLLPTNGKMSLFSTSLGYVGMQFDIDLCNLKGEKYIWPSNAYSDERQWVGRSASGTPSISLEKLRETLRQNVTSGIVPYHNEILACLAKEALTSVFALQNTIESRLYALRIKHIYKTQLNLDLPILIISPATGPLIYSRKMILADIQNANNNPHTTANAILSSMQLTSSALNSLYQKELLAEEKAEVYQKNVKSLFKNNLKTGQYDAALKMLERKSVSYVLEQEQELINWALYKAINNKQPELALKILSKLTSISNYVKEDDEFLKIDGIIFNILQLAATHDQIEILDELLAKSITPLVLATTLIDFIKKDKTDLSLKLLKHQSNVSGWYEPVEKRSMFYLALLNNNETVMEALLNKGADPFFADKNNISPIQYILETHSSPNKLKLIAMILNRNINTAEQLLSALLIILVSPVPSDQEKIELIQQHRTKLGSGRSNLLKASMDSKQPILFATLLDNNGSLLNSRYADSWTSFVTNSAPYFSAEQAVTIVDKIEKLMQGVTSQTDKDKAILIAISNKRYEIAVKMFEMGAKLSEKSFATILASYPEGAIRLINSPNISGKFLINAFHKSSNQSPPAPAQVALANKVAIIYETSNIILANNLQEYRKKLTGQLAEPVRKRNFSFFSKTNPIIAISAVSKLINQLKSGNPQTFTEEEISSISSLSLLANFKKSKLILKSSIQLHTQTQLDKGIISKRYSGKNPKDKLTNIISAIDVDLKKQHDKLIFRLLKATNVAQRENITAKLNATLSAQDSLHAFQRGSIDLSGFNYQMTRVLEQARDIRPETAWGRFTRGFKRIFGKHLGDSTTAKIINHAVADIHKLNQDTDMHALPAIASITRKDSLSSLDSINSKEPIELISSAKHQLVELVDKDEHYHDVANLIIKILIELEKRIELDQVNGTDAVVDFRKALRMAADSVKSFASSPAHVEFQKIIYNNLIAAAKLEPVNNEKQDPINFDVLAEIPPESVIYLSDGYFFEASSLVNWIKTRGIMDNPVTRSELMENDKLAIINAAEKLNINLKDLSPNSYKVEEDEVMLSAAIAIALDSDEPNNILQAGQAQALQNFGHFQQSVDNSFLQAVADATGKSVEHWKTYQIEHPYRFTRIANSAPYIKQGFLTEAEAIALSPDQSESLAMLTTMEMDITPADLAAQVRAIINPNNSNRP